MWIALLLGAAGAICYFFVVPKIRDKFLTTTVKTGDIARVSPAQAQVELSATGYVVAQIAAKVAAKVPGWIAEIFVEEGQVIEKGAKVARLEDVDHKSALATARARAAAARAKVQIARGALTEVKVSLERDQALADKGVIARAPVEDMETRAASLAASIRAAEAEAAAADAETRSLEVQLGSYLITTPIAGTVVDKLVEVGEGVSPGFGTPGVVEVIDMTSLVVEVDVPESKLSQVVVDRPAEIVLDAYPAKRYRGAVKEIGRRVNRAKATVPVKVKFIDRPAEVLPEMAARVSFLREALDEKSLQVPPKLVVPTRAVVQRKGAEVVFVLDDGEVRMVTVQAGAPFGDGRELLTEIPAGTKVVLDPPADLTDGQKVKEEH
ncbi:MAG: efflux RND transporter periplasmic adaptor subunit [Kofleriaceae bacterium]